MLLLLDIDGVMAPACSWKQLEPLEDGFYQFSPQAVKTLSLLLDEHPNITVWLTSSHKSKFSIVEWKKIFANRGLKINKLHALEENTEYLSRKDEILRWHKKHGKQKTRHFIILDDDKSLNELPASMKKKLLLTNATVGLNESHLATAKTILSPQKAKSSQ